MSVKGIRVVRGPDWNYGKTDGGDGHVGTVTKDNEDDTVEVMFITLGHNARKPVFGGFANNTDTGADQPAHPRSLISAFVIRFLESNI